MNPYTKFITDYERLINEAKMLPLGGLPPAPRPDLAFDAPRVLIFSPHPDDECIIGGLALRWMREARMNVLNVAVTQGSSRARQAERFAELEDACHHLGFGLVATGASGLERISPKTREQDPAHWAGCVEVIAGILANNRPKAILFPHDQDWNSTHVGTHHLVMDALRKMPIEFECHLVETEYWAPMATPNLMVEITATDLADMVSALTFHVGEVKRNPYHVSVPAWMYDNVRRAEIVGGQGCAAPDFAFATIYRLRKWSQGRVTNVLTAGKFLSQEKNSGELFA
jgi:LmbE family N-acetylglucosaminyl deacetylase